MGQSLLLPLLSALLLGVLSGAERERVQRRDGYQDFAGIRTFALIAVFGFLSGYVDRFVPHFLLAAFVSCFALVTAGYLYNAFVKGHSGITTEVSSVATFLVGFLCLDHLAVAIVAGILLPLVMALKEISHRLMERVSDAEFFSALKFCIIAFVILPLLPDRTVDPWGLVNPAKLWQTIVFITGVSFLGYVLMRAVGIERGSRLTGLFGGLASSTAVTASFGAESREIGSDRNATLALVTGLMMAVSSSFIRIVALTWITNAAVGTALLPRLSFVAGVIILCAGLAWHFVPRTFSYRSRPVDLGTPFSLWKAAQFALVLLLIIIASEWGTRAFGERGIYLASVLSGMAKGDGIAVAVAAMVGRGTMDISVAVSAILVSVATSFVSKTVLARLSGTGRYARLFGLSMLPAFLAVLVLAVTT